MTSATEQFREGLDEREIEYKAINRLVTDIQRNGLFIRVYDYGDHPDCQMCIEMRCKTSEQAIEVIAATLGPGTCYPVPIYGFDGEFTEYECDECSKCGTEWDGDTPNFCPWCGAKVVSE